MFKNKPYSPDRKFSPSSSGSGHDEGLTDNFHPRHSKSFYRQIRSESRQLLQFINCLKIVWARYQQMPISNPGKSSPSGMAQTAVFWQRCNIVSVAIVKLQSKVQTPVLGPGADIHGLFGSNFLGTRNFLGPTSFCSKNSFGCTIFVLAQHFFRTNNVLRTKKKF